MLIKIRIRFKHKGSIDSKHLNRSSSYIIEKHNIFKTTTQPLLNWCIEAPNNDDFDCKWFMIKNHQIKTIFHPLWQGSHLALLDTYQTIRNLCHFSSMVSMEEESICWTLCSRVLLWRIYGSLENHLPYILRPIFYIINSYSSGYIRIQQFSDDILRSQM